MREVAEFLFTRGLKQCSFNICCRINNNSNETLTYTFFREDELNPKSKKRQPHLAKFSDDECIHHDTSAYKRNNIMNQDLIHGTISFVAAKAFTLSTSENKTKP